MPNKIALFLASLFIGAGVLGGCTPRKKAEPPVSKKIRVLASTTIVEDMIRQTLGDLVEIDSLMGPGTDPHLYVASARDYAKIKTANIVVYSGLHLEAKLGDLFHGLEKSKKVIELSSFLPTDKVIFDSIKVPDPHFWFDPELWLIAGEGFSKRMQQEIPDQKGVIEDNFIRWRRAVNESITFTRTQFAKIPVKTKVLVTSHDAFRYFGRFFDLEVMSVLGVSTDAQISIKKIENLVKDIKTRSIPSVFLETSVSPYAIQRIQEESGAHIGGELYGDSLGGPDTTASTYVGMLKHNASTIMEGLTRAAK